MLWTYHLSFNYPSRAKLRHSCLGRVLGYQSKFNHVNSSRLHTQLYCNDISWAQYDIYNEWRDLNEGRVRSDEDVWELIRRVYSIKEGIDIVVLNEITASCTQEVDCTRKYGFGFGWSNHVHNFGLVFPVVIQLLAQWNGALQNQKPPKKVILVPVCVCSKIPQKRCAERERERERFLVSVFTYSWDVLS